MTAFDEFETAMLRQIVSCLGLPYEELTKDYDLVEQGRIAVEQYAARTGRLEQQRKALQHKIYVYFLRTTYGWSASKARRLVRQVKTRKSGTKAIPSLAFVDPVKPCASRNPNPTWPAHRNHRASIRWR